MQEQYIHIDEDGDKFFYKDKQMDILHREDGPAIEYANGHKTWYINGKLHREDGPAAEWAGGDKSWWINGEHLTEEEFNQQTNPIVELTLEDIAAKFGINVDKLKIKK